MPHRADMKESHQKLFVAYRHERTVIFIRDSQGLVCFEPVVVHDVLSSLSNGLHLPQRAWLATLEVGRVHGDDIAAFVLLCSHEQLHSWLADGANVLSRRKSKPIQPRTQRAGAYC